ncbi:baculoviral IAP repeat-containing protein 7 [Elysia marginata]|uniref:Baculoviral IAP repeat-containing protein 7 n=1 Tax=Elysia marginata TaxID=1093978 RepID=A0AAV4J8H5_9GAST|nr:baculoviral IAP repeat-containing protein 7 [Elysia marginata]
MNTNALKMLQQFRRVAMDDDDNPKEDVSCHTRWLMNAMDEYIEKEEEEEGVKKKRDARQQSKKKFIPLPCTDPEKKPNIWAADDDDEVWGPSVYPEMEDVKDRRKSFPRHHHRDHNRTLADLGFFYSGGDCIRCFHCGLERKKNWAPDDNVSKGHYENSPECNVSRTARKKNRTGR